MVGYGMAVDEVALRLSVLHNLVPRQSLQNFFPVCEGDCAQRRTH